MLARKLTMLSLALLVLVVPFRRTLTAASFPQSDEKKDAILKASDITPAIFPEKVFYHGRVADVQMRNTGGIHFADGVYVLAGLVDTSGYASGLKEKYQAYFLSEVPVEINGQLLKPGAYGVGFVGEAKFIVSDLGGGTILETAGQRDANLKRPTPLQVLAAPEDGTYRLYLGRNFVVAKRAK
jgi:hypothetical protein